MTSQVPWRRILAESAAIVVSILLAFGIDAAWDSRRALGETRALLTALETELVENRALLDRAEEEMREGQGRIRFFLSSTQDEFAAIPKDQTNFEFHRWAIRDSRAQFTLGVLEASIGSGSLALLPETDTGAALSELMASIRGLDLVLTQLDDSGNRAAAAIGSIPSARSAWTGQLGFESGALREFHSDRDLVGQMAARSSQFNTYRALLATTVLPRLEESISLIRRDLADLR